MSLYNLSHVIPHTQYSCLLGDVMSLYNLSHVIPHTQYSCLLGDVQQNIHCCILGDVMSLSHVIPHTHSIVVYWGTLCP